MRHWGKPNEKSKKSFNTENKIDALTEKFNAFMTAAGNTVESFAEQVFTTMVAHSGGNKDEKHMKFDKFVFEYEKEFNDGNKISKRERRGLRYALDENPDGDINLGEWLDFMKKFNTYEEENAGKTMDDFMMKLCDDCPPTKFELAKNNIISGSKEAMKRGTETAEKLGRKASAKIDGLLGEGTADKGKKAAAAAAAKGKAMMGKLPKW